MPPEYKYEFITKGRMKALNLAHSRYSELRKQLSKSGIIAPSILEEMRITGLLLTRAASAMVGSAEDVQILEKLLGPDLGETYK
jgi:hypothetical protein